MKTGLQPILHNELQDISEVQEMNDEDIECLDEIRQVIKKYRKEEKFGVALLHKHFDLSDNEILVETIKVSDRVLTSQPITKDEAKRKKLIQTMWCFSEDINFSRGCESYCPTDENGRHFGYKGHDPKD